MDAEEGDLRRPRATQETKIRPLLPVALGLGMMQFLRGEMQFLQGKVQFLQGEEPQIPMKMVEACDVAVQPEVEEVEEFQV
ncbi:hypothetical protein N7490_002466 [Penicillium lividum]|nr:hypothetical protein N7490_002466 [Penicillium lividum]